MTRPAIRVNRGPEYTRIWGLGDYRPEQLVMNDEIVHHIDSSDEWIRDRSGIASRRRAADHEGVVQMAREASLKALEHAGITIDQVDMILVATLTHPLQTPAAAPLVAHQLGSRAAAYDISAACAGYCYGIGMADAMIRAGQCEYALVIGVERMLSFTRQDDRSTAFIFGDGAGAAVVGPSDFPGIGPTVWGSDGSGWGTIRQTPNWLVLKEHWDNPEAPKPDWPHIHMEGQAVFRWASFEMPKVVGQALDAAGITVDDLDVFIPHQANIRIIDQMCKKLRLPDHVVVARDDIVDMANTSAASVPLATTRMLREGKAKSGDVAVQMGFGAGLAYAAQVVVLP